MITNPKTLAWVNSTQAIDPSGATIAWDPTKDQGGVQIAFDGQPAVSIPSQAVMSSIALAVIAGYTALAAGQHTATVSEVTKEGVVSPPSVAVTFLTAVVPLAPTNLTLA